MQEHSTIEELERHIAEPERLLKSLEPGQIFLNRNKQVVLFCAVCRTQLKSRGKKPIYCSAYCATLGIARRRGRQSYGASKHPLHKAWRSMVSRCHNSKDPAYKNYGARGITVCPEWTRNFWAFAAWAEGQDRPPNTTLDRVDNNSGYRPSNCTYATASRQQRNRRNTLFFEAFGERKSAADWAEDSRCVVGLITLRDRIRRLGMSAEIAITTPPDNNGATIRRVHKRYKSNSVMLTAFGETKPISEWALDPRCKVGEFALRRRISSYFVDHETAITSAPYTLRRLPKVELLR